MKVLRTGSSLRVKTDFSSKFWGVWGLETSLLISGFPVPFPVLLLLWLPIFFIPNNSSSLCLYSLNVDFVAKLTSNLHQGVILLDKTVLFMRVLANITCYSTNILSLTQTLICSKRLFTNYLEIC